MNRKLDKKSQNHNGLICCFKNCTSPEVINKIDIYTVFEIIREPQPEIKYLIDLGREDKNNGRQKDYDDLKRRLPCVTFNFEFNNYKRNENIKASTGLIYIDVDGNTSLDLNNPYIFSSWVSLSGQGRGVLVKVKNLTPKNFKETYLEISRKLNISSDKRAGKATQFTVLSYDKDIYINNNSFTWYAIDRAKKKPNTVSLKKRKKGVTELGLFSSIRYDNIDDYDFKGKDYIFFEGNKEPIATLYLPKQIYIGERNEKLAPIAYQLKALNKWLEDEEFEKIVQRINYSLCEMPLEKKEVKLIISQILKQDDIQPTLNKKRRIIFNPESTLTKEEKINISNKLNGELKSKKTIEFIRETVENWNLELGKITQTKLAKEAGKNIKTIKKYYKLLKAEIKLINLKIVAQNESTH